MRILVVVLTLVACGDDTSSTGAQGGGGAPTTSSSGAGGSGGAGGAGDSGGSGGSAGSIGGGPTCWECCCFDGEAQDCIQPLAVPPTDTCMLECDPCENPAIEPECIPAECQG
ncbi:MAG: hypothetical protein HOW73_27175 [Polyangiaceae bacterium]|nr:hypothetical protein [Polyangiaceae bacterium]